MHLKNALQIILTGLRWRLREISEFSNLENLANDAPDVIFDPKIVQNVFAFLGVHYNIKLTCPPETKTEEALESIIEELAGGINKIGNYCPNYRRSDLASSIIYVFMISYALNFLGQLSVDETMAMVLNLAGDSAPERQYATIDAALALRQHLQQLDPAKGLR